MYIELIIVIVTGAFIVLFVSTTFLEKQYIQDFAPAISDRSSSNSSYFIAMNNEAMKLGFTPAGLFDQKRKSRIYQAHLALWISEDRQTLLRIAGGKTAGMPIKRSALTSFVEPNLIVETWDYFGMVDISGLTDRKIVLNAHLKELLAHHQNRVSAYSGTKQGFSTAQSLVAYEALMAMKTTAMERRGLAKFVDREKGVWRHTLKGAWVSYAKGFRRQLAEGKAQQDRINLKRPGAQ